MPSIEITVESLPYAHRLHCYCGECAHVHGHNAKVVVVIEADEIDAQGFVVDFYVAHAALSRVLSRFNHRLVVAENDPLVAVMRGAGERVEPFHATPTAENLARYVLDQLNVEARTCSPPGRPWRCVRASWQEEPGFVAVATP